MPSPLAAQVGINIDDPDSLSVLHVFSNTNKGVLLPNFIETYGSPNVTEPEYKTELLQERAHGMLFFNRLNSSFRFYNKNTKEFQTINPWDVRDDDFGNTDTIISHAKVKINDNLFLRKAQPKNYGITKNGIRIDAKDILFSKCEHTPYSSTYSVEMDIDVAKVTTVNATTVNSTSVSATTVNATTVTATTVNATTVNGYGTLPVGGIIMWSGNVNNIPDGWALCTGQSVNGNQTPNLSGRFIVSYDTGDQSGEYNAIKAGVKGTGNRTVSLTEANLPAHSHSGKSDPDGVHTHDINVEFEPFDRFEITRDINAKGRVWDKIKHSAFPDKEGVTSISNDLHTHDVIVNSNSAVHAAAGFDARPPYYVLAFIMRVR